MNEQGQFTRVRQRVNELMNGGPFGDGIGPGSTAWHVNKEFGTTYEAHEIWRIWRQGKAWTNPKDDIYPI